MAIEVRQIATDKAIKAFILGDYKPSIDDTMKLFIFRIKIEGGAEMNIYAKNLLAAATDGRTLEIMKKKEKSVIKIMGVVYDEKKYTSVLWG